MKEIRDHLERMERVLKTLVFTLLFILIVSQVLLFLPSMRPVMNMALRLEGEPLKAEELVQFAGGISTTPWATVTLKLLEYNSLPQVKISLDGTEVANFLQNEVVLTVKNGNIITIHNREDGPPITVVITKKTPNVLFPEVDSMVQGNGRLYFQPVVIR